MIGASTAAADDDDDDDVDNVRDGDGLSENVTVFGSDRFDGGSFDFKPELSTMMDFVFTFSFESLRS